MILRPSLRERSETDVRREQAVGRIVDRERRGGGIVRRYLIREGIRRRFIAQTYARQGLAQRAAVGGAGRYLTRSAARAGVAARAAAVAAPAFVVGAVVLVGLAGARLVTGRTTEGLGREVARLAFGENIEAGRAATATVRQLQGNPQAVFLASQAGDGPVATDLQRYADLIEEREFQIAQGQEAIANRFQQFNTLDLLIEVALRELGLLNENNKLSDRLKGVGTEIGVGVRKTREAQRGQRVPQTG